MDKINYLEIFKKAWKITWQNKYLWWFGLFIMLGPGGMNFNSPGGSGDSNKNADEIFQKAESFISDYFLWIMAAVGIMILIALGLWILKIIAQAGLIKTLQDEERIKDGTFANGMKMGRKYLWKLVGLSILLNFSILVVAAVVIIPIAFLFNLKAYIPAIFITIIAVVIVLPLMVLVSFLGSYGRFYVVGSNMPIRASLEMAYATFRKNILASIVMSLLFIPIGMVLVLGFIALVFILALIFLLIGFLFNLALGKIGIIIAAALGGLIFLGVIFFAGSAYQVFYQTSWWLFFQEIAGIKKTEKEVKTIAEEILVSQDQAA